MKMKFVALLLVLALCLGLGVGAYAAAANQTISATLNRTIKVTYNGEEQAFRDANGNAVYPISYNGTTYLPVRAVSGLLDVAVDWDPAAQTVILGESEKQPVGLVKRPSSGDTKYSWIISKDAELEFSGSGAKHTYENGIAWNQWNGTLSTSKSRLVYFDVTGYAQLTFTAAAGVRAKVNVYDQDYNILTSFEMKAGDVVTKVLPLDGAAKIAFGSDYPSVADAPWDTTDGFVYIYEPVLS